MVQVIRVILYVISGIFAFAVSIISFISIPSVSLAVKLSTMATSGIMGLILILIARATHRFRGWKMPLGITFLSGVGCVALTIFTQICMEASPQLHQTFPDYQNIFRDYSTGGVTTGCFLIVGLALVLSSSKREVFAEV